jgi:hypothetical protein
MKQYHATPTDQRGGLILSLALTVFFLALIAAGFVLWQLWRDGGDWSDFKTLVMTGQRPTPASTTTPADPLLPTVQVDRSLQDQYVELETSLITPLRAYYATKPERLGTITVEPADTEQHTTRVTFELWNGSESTTHRFFYDRTGEERQGPYPAWEPTLLDVTD